MLPPLAARRSRWAVALACAVATGCAAEFDPGSKIENLRVLGVRKSAPYARPGQAVDLQLLWHDAGAPREGQAVPQIAWAAVCRNPPGDLFEQCFAQVPDADPDDLANLISLPEPGASTPNDRFSFETAPDIISSRPPPAGGAAPYGLHYVFFAVCAGSLTPTPGGGLPFGCYEEIDGEPGLTGGDEQLDSTRFIVGYTAVFVYEEFTNENPLVTGMEFGDMTLWPASAAAGAPEGAVVLAPPDLCVGSECAATPADDGAACPAELTFPACDDDCDDIPVRPLVDPSSAELDAAASARGETLLEQMWVNYYAARGEIDEEVRLLNDATQGWNEDFGTSYRLGEEPGVAYVWAVAHDNRGGAEWARVRLCIEAP